LLGHGAFGWCGVRGGHARCSSAIRAAFFGSLTARQQTKSAMAGRIICAIPHARIVCAV
jgi:hypothetical protein